MKIPTGFTEKNENEYLLKIAEAATKKSYSPYSGFSVGAALLTDSGKIYVGCNVENSSYSATICAERTALFSAVSNGERNFKKIAVVGKQNGKLMQDCVPCGVCLQVLSEFCKKDFIILTHNENTYKERFLYDLLPNSFTLKKI